MSSEAPFADALSRVEARWDKDISEIKDSMRRMSDAMVTLARIEERQSQDRDHIGRLFNLSDDHEKRLKDLEKAEPAQKRTTAWVDKAVSHIVMLVLATIVSTVVVKVSAPAAPANPPVIATPK